LKHAKAASAGSIESTGSARGSFGRALATRGASGNFKGSGARSLLFALTPLLAVLALLLFGTSSALAATPELKIDPTVTADYTTVEVAGEIDPEGDSVFWYLEFSTDDGNSWQEGFGFGESPSGELEGTTPQPLTNLVQKGLAPGTTYMVRLAVYDYTTNEVVTSPEPNPEFTTKSLPAPTVTIDPVSAATASTAHFSGKITPNSPAGDPPAADVTWHFVCEPSCPAAEGEQTVLASAGETEVELEAGELQPSTAYEVRLVGKNAGDPVTAGPVSFQTEALPAPTISFDPITTFTDTTATFVGHIDPNKPATGEAAASDVQWSFQCQPECPGLSGGTVPGTATGSERDVEVHATGLEPNSEYTVTLTGSNRGGPVSAAPQTFSTVELPATVGVGPGGAIGVGGYRLEGTVNPHNSVISECFFEWGSDTSYGHSAPCEPAPGSDNKVNFVTAQLSTLTVGAEYHFRLVAANGTGPVHTSDEIFLAHPPCPNEALRAENNSTQLPECRAYEQVTPVFKEAFPPAVNGLTDDGRLTYLSNGNYANNGNGEAAIPGGNLYLEERTASGWSTHALSPPSPEFHTYDTNVVPKAIASDLRSTLWEMRRGDEPETANDLYLRRGDAFTHIGPLTKQPGTTVGGTSIQTSDDLSHMVFLGPNGVEEYVDNGSGEPRVVSVDNADLPIAPGCGNILGGLKGTYHVVSADGRVIFWTSACTDTAGVRTGSVYARVNAATTIDASESQCTRAPSDPGGVCNAGSEAHFEGANKDGTRVYFTTSQQLVNGDTDETTDLYECDIPSGTPTPVGAINPCPDLREVSGAASGADVQGVTRISDDGSRAYFLAAGVLASNTDANDAIPVAGDHNLYVWQRDAAHPVGETRFVGKLAQADSPTQTSGGLWGPDLAARLAQATDDGRYLVFASYAQLIDHGPQADTDTARDIYRYDAETGSLARLSTDVDGAGGNEPGQDAQITPIAYDTKVTSSSRPPRAAVSDDGGSVVFTTTEALAPNDTNGTVDTYLWHDGRVSLISTGQPSADGPIPGVGDSYLGTSNLVLALISPSGRDVYFTTTAQLIPGDADTVLDIYDARVDGGFPSASAPTPCTAESCRPSASPPPTPLHSTSQGLGAGNPPTVRRCPKGKAKKHGRCVKKHGKKKRHVVKHRQAARYRHAEDEGGRK
jgi:hypothetical protein